MKNYTVGIVSGGMDPHHEGHIRMFQEAKEQSDYLICLLNSDDWLMMKKGFVFSAQNARKEILEAIRYIDEVIITSHKTPVEDMSVAEDIRNLYKRLDTSWSVIFFNGGDKIEGTLPTAEEEVCKELGIKLIYGVGGGKVQSSSDLVKRFNGSRTILEAK